MAADLALAFAEGVVGKLGEIALNQALSEASLLYNFKSDFTWLERKLRQICHSVQAADEQSEQNKNVTEWLVEVRNIALDAEDIIDECAVEHLYTNSSRSWFCSCFQLMLSSISNLVFQYQMGKRIKDIKDRIKATIEEATQLKLFHEVSHLHLPSTSTSQSERGAELRRWSIVDKDAPAVAVDYKVHEIQALLENTALPVIAVVGMGGVGKTFLLQHVFNRSKHGYDCSAWISVSQTCSLRKLQCDLVSYTDFEIDSRISDLRAAELIHGKLDGRRCLIVLDDVWRTSVQGNFISRLGLPTGRDSQCKIVVTTRSRDVAQNLNAHIHEMEHLSEEESWELFCQFAFPDREGNRPPQQLERLGRQIVEECGTLPLALKTVAASLSKSLLTTSDWESKLEQLKKLKNAGHDPTMKILKLSYDTLPSNLKSCFAYFSFFPEDTYISFSSTKAYRADIYLDYVIYLWIAEGYIPQQIDREQWDIGLDYVHHLVNLCLLEVNRVFSCYTIHDMLLDLAVNICKEHDCEFSLPSEEISCRRLLVARKDVATNEISERPLNCQRVLRTLSFSGNSGITSIPEQLLDHARVLRVVDLSHSSISTLPKCVGKLKLLKVLNLSYTQIREVPDCVRRLKSLQYLDVSYCKLLQCLPEWIGELKSLSYLNVQWIGTHVLDMPKGMSELSCLRTLKSDHFLLSFDENELLTVEDVGKLTSLQELRFGFKDVRVLRSAEDGAFDGLVKMRILAVSNRIPDVMEGDREESTSLPTFPEKMKLMKDLQQLYLDRFSVPSWICGMQNLTDLVLSNCNGYSSLQKMPNLQKLVLLNDLKCRELPEEFGEMEGFPKLAQLHIRNFPVLEELPALEEGAMQCLVLLIINNCPQVKRVPEGLEKLRRLKRIDVVGKASGELEERLKEDGEDWKKIKAKNFRTEIYFLV